MNSTAINQKTKIPKNQYDKYNHGNQHQNHRNNYYQNYHQNPYNGPSHPYYNNNQQPSHPFNPNTNNNNNYYNKNNNYNQNNKNKNYANANNPNKPSGFIENCVDDIQVFILSKNLMCNYSRVSIECAPFNADKRCKKGQNCKKRHKCILCNGPHSIMHCPNIK